MRPARRRAARLPLPRSPQLAKAGSVSDSKAAPPWPATRHSFWTARPSLASRRRPPDHPRGRRTPSTLKPYAARSELREQAVQKLRREGRPTVVGVAVIRILVLAPVDRR